MWGDLGRWGVGDLGIVRGGGGGPGCSKRWGCGGPGYSKRWGWGTWV